MAENINKSEELFKKDLQKIIEDVCEKLSCSDEEEFSSYAKIGQMRFNAIVNNSFDIILKNSQLNEFVVYAQNKKWTYRDDFIRIVNQYREVNQPLCKGAVCPVYASYLKKANS
jgi:hypothetical protein